MQTSRIFVFATLVAIIAFSLGATIGYVAILEKNTISLTTTTETLPPQTIYSVLTSGKTETIISTFTSTDFTEITPIFVTSATTTTLSTVTKSVSSYSFMISGSNLLENFPYLFGNSTVELIANNSAFSLYQENSATMNLTINGNANMVSIVGGQLNLFVNGDSNRIFNQTLILSQQINGTGNNVTSMPTLP